MERIVFNQNELDMIGTEAGSVALCDNDYIISPSPDTEYIAIGTVNAVVKCSAVQAISLGLTFIGFDPVFDGNYEPAPMARKELPSSFVSSFTSSFKGSFSSSFTTSYTTSFSSMYEYEYRIGSFSGSFKGGSFKLSTSFTVGSMRMTLKKRPVVREISVNGYGLNLI